MQQDNPVGAISWVDLTVEDAERIREFYSQVVGWDSDPVEMGSYNDFSMLAPDSGECVAGICHARGVNAELPPHWLVYITVADLDASVARCQELGGRLVAGPNSLGETARYCVIEDPAGAVAALFESR